MARHQLELGRRRTLLSQLQPYRPEVVIKGITSGVTAGGRRVLEEALGPRRPACPRSGEGKEHGNPLCLAIQGIEKRGRQKQA